MLKTQIGAHDNLSIVASARSGFCAVWRKVTTVIAKERGEEGAEGEIKVFESLLANAVASNNVELTESLLGEADVNSVLINAEFLPPRLVRMSKVCSVLDLAFGSGAVDVARFLLLYHDVRPTLETMKMSISSGDRDLMRLAWLRLSASERAERPSLLKVAADFHQAEMVAWLLRDADLGEKQLFVEFAIGQHLADVLLIVLADGFKPILRVRDPAVTWKWALAREIVFSSAPEAFGSRAWSGPPSSDAPAIPFQARTDRVGPVSRAALFSALCAFDEESLADGTCDDESQLFARFRALVAVDLLHDSDLEALIAVTQRDFKVVQLDDFETVKTTRGGKMSALVSFVFRRAICELDLPPRADDANWLAGVEFESVGRALVELLDEYAPSLIKPFEEELRVADSSHAVATILIGHVADLKDAVSKLTVPLTVLDGLASALRSESVKVLPAEADVPAANREGLKAARWWLRSSLPQIVRRVLVQKACAMCAPRSIPTSDVITALGDEFDLDVARDLIGAEVFKEIGPIINGRPDGNPTLLSFAYNESINGTIAALASGTAPTRMWTGGEINVFIEYATTMARMRGLDLSARDLLSRITAEVNSQRLLPGRVAELFTTAEGVAAEWCAAAQRVLDRAANGLSIASGVMSLWHAEESWETTVAKAEMLLGDVLSEKSTLESQHLVVHAKDAYDRKFLPQVSRVEASLKVLGTRADCVSTFVEQSWEQLKEIAFETAPFGRVDCEFVCAQPDTRVLETLRSKLEELSESGLKVPQFLKQLASSVLRDPRYDDPRLRERVLREVNWPKSDITDLLEEVKRGLAKRIASKPSRLEPVTPVFDPALRKEYERVTSELNLRDAEVVARLPARVAPGSDVFCLPAATITGKGEFDSTLSAVMCGRMAGGSETTVLGDQVSVPFHQQATGGNVCIGECAPAGVAVPRMSKSSLRNMSEMMEDMKARIVGAKAKCGRRVVAVLGTHNHGLEYGLVVVLDDGQVVVLSFETLLGMAIDLGSGGDVSALVADFCSAAGGLASEFRVARLFTGIPTSNLLVYASGVGFEKSYVCGGLEMVSGSGLISGSVFMRVMSRVCGFNWTSPSNRLRRLFGVTLARLICTPGTDATALGEIFSGPELGPDVTLGLALGWLDIPVSRGFFPIAKVTRALPSSDTLFSILSELYNGSERLARIGVEGRRGGPAMVPLAVFVKVARAMGDTDPIVKWNLIRSGKGAVPTRWVMARTFSALWRKGIRVREDQLPFFALVGEKGDAAVASAVESV